MRALLTIKMVRSSFEYSPRFWRYGLSNNFPVYRSAQLVPVSKYMLKKEPIRQLKSARFHLRRDLHSVIDASRFVALMVSMCLSSFFRRKHWKRASVVWLCSESVKSDASRKMCFSAVADRMTPNSQAFRFLTTARVGPSRKTRSSIRRVVY